VAPGRGRGWLSRVELFRSKSVDRLPPAGYAIGVKRLELARIRVCNRCGRGGAELRGEDGERLVIPLDPGRARELADANGADDVRSLTELLLEQLAAGGLAASEVVLDVADGRLRALLSFVRASEPDVVGCTPEEGIALAVRGGLKIYATDEALAHATAGGSAAKQDRHGGTGGPDTIH